MAIRASVTVSIADDTSGTRNVMSRVSRVLVSTSLGTTSEAAGSSSTSSKVRPTMATLVGSSPPVRTGPRDSLICRPPGGRLGLESEDSASGVPGSNRRPRQVVPTGTVGA